MVDVAADAERCHDGIRPQLVQLMPYHLFDGSDHVWFGEWVGAENGVPVAVTVPATGVDAVERLTQAEVPIAGPDQGARGAFLDHPVAHRVVAEPALLVEGPRAGRQGRGRRSGEQ
ncbi:MAG: hypothetical protein M3Z25_02770 [Actinomycetota bacterium]|nr:hypothetical protein [Actinomycetota bacterium]